jgi:hypothetical protein
LRADAVRYADGRTDLALTWLHMLFDGWGSERFVEFLEQCRSGARAPDAVPAPTVRRAARRRAARAVRASAATWRWSGSAG